MSAATLSQRPKQFARTAGSLVFLTGVVVLLGWALDLSALKSVLPGWATMRANTALAFALAGLTLSLLTAKPRGLPLAETKQGLVCRWTALSCAGIVVLIGLLTLSEYLIGWNLGIDRLLFEESPGVPGDSPPGRMAPATALNFLVLGCALLLAGGSRWIGTFQSLILLGGLIGWLGFSQYLYGGEPLLPYAQMAVHTAIAFVILSAGLLSSRPDGGLMALLISDSPGGVIARQLVPSALLVPIVFGWLHLQGQRAGWFGTEAGLSLFVLFSVLAFGALIWATAALLHHSDSARKQAEESLRKSEAFLGKSQEIAHVGSWELSLPEGETGWRGLLYWSDETCRIFGLTPGEVEPSSELFYNLVHSEDRQRVRETFSRALAERKPYVCEHRIVRSDGAPRDVHQRADVICDETTGRPVRVLGTLQDITERKQAEQALRESEERARLIVDTALDAVITIDSPGLVTSWNPQAEAIFGWKRAEVLGHPLRETIIPERYRESHQRGLQRYLATGRAVVLNRRIELTALHRDGHELPVELSITPIQTGAGVSFSAFVRDITERKTAAEALTRERNLLRMLIDNLPAYIYVKDAKGRYLLNNAANARLIGAAAEAETLGKTVFDFFPAEIARLYDADDRQVLAAARPLIDREEPGQDRERNARWFLTTKLPLRHSDGSVIGLLGITQDTTERKQAEIKLRAQLSRLDLLSRITRAIGERQDLHSIFQVVIRSLEDDLPIDFGCVCLYEPATETLTVTSVGAHSETLAMELALTQQSRIAIDQNGLARCLRGHVVYEPENSQVQFPFPQQLALGGLRSLVAAPLLVESNVFGILVAARKQPNGFSSAECEFLRQLSEHVALAAHQAQLYNALQQAYDDLRKTQQAVMQQERLSALGQMASGIAHNINNAISPVALYTGSLLESEPNLSARARDYLETIEHAVDDVAATIARMREFYRQREPQLTLAPVHLNRLVQQVLDLTRARWRDMPQQRGIVIAALPELVPDLPAIMGVESELREALTNLIFNAVDAMPEGGSLTLRTRVAAVTPSSGEASAPQRVQVEVIDTGVGMDEDTRRRCLEPFFTTKGERGTGLGLAMVYGVAQRHGAEIEIEGAVGKGTTTRLSFPVPAAAVAGPAQPEIVPAVPSRLRILVVDDDPLLLKSLRDTLETEGHMVVTANSGQAGIDNFRAAQERGEPFAVVITDLGMPYLDGSRVADAVKDASPSTPVILLTGWGKRLVAEGDVPPRVDRVLSKPPKLRELREALALCCQRAGS